MSLEFSPISCYDIRGFQRGFARFGQFDGRGQETMELTVKLQVFEGPLDLLLHLLDKNKVNIYDIPIVEITA